MVSYYVNNFLDGLKRNAIWICIQATQNFYKMNIEIPKICCTCSAVLLFFPLSSHSYDPFDACV